MLKLAAAAASKLATHTHIQQTPSLLSLFSLFYLLCLATHTLVYLEVPFYYIYYVARARVCPLCLSRVIIGEDAAAEAAAADGLFQATHRLPCTIDSSMITYCFTSLVYNTRYLLPLLNLLFAKQ